MNDTIAVFLQAISFHLVAEKLMREEIKLIHSLNRSINERRT